MELTGLILIILFAIVLSDIVGNIFPWLPMPLIQIGFGAVIAITPLNIQISLNPETFLAFVVAPLLFREAEESDIITLWKMKRQVILMAFLLVFVAVFAVGGFVHWILPTIPLAACFALGAILGPTDMIAVTTIGKSVRIPTNLMNVLKGEGLINDASGVIAFNFAVIAMKSGSFSALDAVGTFLFMCFGGALIGLILVFLKEFALKIMSLYKVKTNSTLLIVEIVVPFICFLTAEHLGCSGIIAAVAAGFRSIFRSTRMDLTTANLNASRRSLWEIISFVLNALVFFLLGLQLPGIVKEVFIDERMDVGFLALAGVLIAIAMFAVRFFALLIIANKIVSHGTERIRETLILTLSGVKGTVSLATAFALPIFLSAGTLFTYRSALLYITAVIIIFTLILSLIALPIISKEKKTHTSNASRIAVLKEVVEDLKQQDNECTSAVILNYMGRIRGLEEDSIRKPKKKEYHELHELVKKMEREILPQKHDWIQATEKEEGVYQHVLAMVHDNEDNGAINNLSRTLRKIKFLFTSLSHRKKMMRNMQTPPDHDQGTRQEMVKKIEEMFWSDTNQIIAVLEENRGRYSDESIDVVIKERIDLVGIAMERLYGGVIRARLHDEYESVLLSAFAIEREKISEHLAAGLLTPQIADTMRVSVNALETFALTDHTTSVLPKLIMNRVQGRRHTSHSRHVREKMQIEETPPEDSE